MSCRDNQKRKAALTHAALQSMRLRTELDMERVSISEELREHLEEDIRVMNEMITVLRFALENWDGNDSERYVTDE